MASRNMEALEKCASELRGHGLRVSALPLDHGNEASILALRDKIQETEGRIDVLVNNSVARPMAKGYKDEASTFAHSMEVNATGVFLVTRAFGDLMAEQKSGSIINIGSIQGMVGPDPTIYRNTAMHGWYPDYFFHKAGMVNFTRFVASYYGSSGVRCNCLSPGGHVTERHDPVFVKQYSERTFLGRMANTTDLMGSIVFLASDASVYVTGVNIPVDGGYTAK